MKYIEELSPGDMFTYSNNHFILTTDFKKRGSKLAYSLIDGSPKWFNSADTVEPSQLYTIDEDNNVVLFKNDNLKIKIKDLS